METEITTETIENDPSVETVATEPQPIPAPALWARISQPPAAKVSPPPPPEETTPTIIIVPPEPDLMVSIRERIVLTPEQIAEYYYENPAYGISYGLALVDT